MVYPPQTWTDGVSVVNGARMTTLENGVRDAHDLTAGVQESLAGKVNLVNATTGQVDGAVEERVRLLAANLSGVRIRYTAGAWPPRSVPTGYTGPVTWDSSLDASAPAPPASINGDDWDQKVV